MKSKLKRFETFIESKKMKQSVEKSKIIQFRRRGWKKRKENWRRKEQKIDQVKETKYLIYHFKKTRDIV